MAPLVAPPPFNRMPASFTRALGIDIEFTTQAGAKTFRAIVREGTDLQNQESGGIGTVGNVAELRLSTIDGAMLANDDMLTYQDVVFKIVGEGDDDGRGMTSFELGRVD